VRASASGLAGGASSSSEAWEAWRASSSVDSSRSRTPLGGGGGIGEGRDTAEGERAAPSVQSNGDAATGVAIKLSMTVHSVR